MKFLGLIFFLWSQSTCFAQNMVVVEIHAPKMKNGTKMQITDCLIFRGQALKKYDFEIMNGKAVKKVLTENGDRFLLRFNKQELSIYLEVGVVKINIPDTTLAAAKIIGSNSDQDMNRWADKWKKEPIYNVTREAQEKWFNETNKTLAVLAQIKHDSIKAIYNQHEAKFVINSIRASPTSYINSSLLYRVKNALSQRQLSDLYGKLSNENKRNAYGRFIKYTLDSLYVNGIAPSFVQSDTSGHQVKLKDFRGKYVLLDFWASWCVPCRAENPNLVKVYERYKKRNFSIIGVSFDSKRDLWIEAIKKDNLTWTHISDLKGWSNALSGKYDIRFVPSNVLISPDGKIIARNLRGNALTEILEKIFQ